MEEYVNCLCVCVCLISGLFVLYPGCMCNIRVFVYNPGFYDMIGGDCEGGWFKDHQVSQWDKERC
jgi:hypothetical protein